jgi:hypothetical protein
MISELLILAGAIINFVGCVMFWVAAKRVGTGWFIACLTIVGWPFFLVAHFHQALKPFAIWLAGFGLVIIGVVIGGSQS